MRVGCGPCRAGSAPLFGDVEHAESFESPLGQLLLLFLRCLGICPGRYSMFCKKMQDHIHLPSVSINMTPDPGSRWPAGFEVARRKRGLSEPRGVTWPA